MNPSKGMKITGDQGKSTSGSPALEPAAIFDAVRHSTGLIDLYEAGLGDRLERLLKHLDEDLHLDFRGRQAAFDSVVEVMKSRSSMLADREKYGAIQDETIDRPLIVTGMPRSGTTVMQSLLAADPGNRAPLYWEVRWPSPPIGISPPDDARIARGDGEMDEICRTNPLVLKSHPYFDYGAHSLVECEAIGAMDFRNVYHSTYFRVPAILSVSLMDDPVAYYRFHMSVLQNLQWKRKTLRWALKGTEHHAYLDAIKKVYPDAIVIWLHRDPYKVVPSIMELLFNWFQDVIGRPLDRPTVGRRVLAMYKAGLHKALQIPAEDCPQVEHILFTEFMADPVAQIKAIYDRQSIPFTLEAETAMRSWLNDPRNASDRYGKFKYSLGDFQMTRREVDLEFATYRARFGIAHEN